MVVAIAQAIGVRFGISTLCDSLRLTMHWIEKAIALRTVRPQRGRPHMDLQILQGPPPFFAMETEYPGVN